MLKFNLMTGETDATVVGTTHYPLRGRGVTRPKGLLYVVMDDGNCTMIIQGRNTGVTNWLRVLTINQTDMTADDSYVGEIYLLDEMRATITSNTGTVHADLMVYVN